MPYIRTIRPIRPMVRSLATTNHARFHALLTERFQKTQIRRNVYFALTFFKRTPVRNLGGIHRVTSERICEFVLRERIVDRERFVDRASTVFQRDKVFVEKYDSATPLAHQISDASLNVQVLHSWNAASSGSGTSPQSSRMTPHGHVYVSMASVELSRLVVQHSLNSKLIFGRFAVPSISNTSSYALMHQDFHRYFFGAGSGDASSAGAESAMLSAMLTTANREARLPGLRGVRSRLPGVVVPARHESVARWVHVLRIGMLMAGSRLARNHFPSAIQYPFAQWTNLSAKSNDLEIGKGQLASREFSSFGRSQSDQSRQEFHRQWRRHAVLSTMSRQVLPQPLKDGRPTVRDRNTTTSVQRSESYLAFLHRGLHLRRVRSEQSRSPRSGRFVWVAPPKLADLSVETGVGNARSLSSVSSVSSVSSFATRATVLNIFRMRALGLRVGAQWDRTLTTQQRINRERTYHLRSNETHVWLRNQSTPFTQFTTLLNRLFWRDSQWRNEVSSTSRSSREIGANRSISGVLHTRLSHIYRLMGLPQTGAVNRALSLQSSRYLGQMLSQKEAIAQRIGRVRLPDSFAFEWLSSLPTVPMTGVIDERKRSVPGFSALSPRRQGGRSEPRDFLHYGTSTPGRVTFQELTRSQVGSRTTVERVDKWSVNARDVALLGAGSYQRSLTKNSAAFTFTASRHLQFATRTFSSIYRWLETYRKGTSTAEGKRAVFSPSTQRGLSMIKRLQSSLYVLTGRHQRGDSAKGFRQVLLHLDRGRWPSVRTEVLDVPLSQQRRVQVRQMVIQPLSFLHTFAPKMRSSRVFTWPQSVRHTIDVWVQRSEHAMMQLWREIPSHPNANQSAAETPQQWSPLRNMLRSQEVLPRIGVHAVQMRPEVRRRSSTDTVLRHIHSGVNQTSSALSKQVQLWRSRWHEVRMTTRIRTDMARTIQASKELVRESRIMGKEMIFLPQSRTELKPGEVSVDESRQEQPLSYRRRLAGIDDKSDNRRQGSRDPTESTSLDATSDGIPDVESKPNELEGKPLLLRSGHLQLSSAEMRKLADRLYRAVMERVRLNQQRRGFK